MIARPRPGLLVALLALAAEARAEPVLHATRTRTPPVIDGKLDDAVWRSAPAVTAFVQRRPAPGHAPRVRSELRVLYDEGALYLGLRLLDDRPRAIRRGLGERDAIPDSDSVTVYLDPAQSRTRGYYFQVNASGQVADGTLSSETTTDGSWDGVWSAEASVDERGWSAELRIPLLSIAFQEEPVQSWGICVERYLQREKETSVWPAIPKDSNVFVSRFATLAGLRGLRRGLSLRLQPYASLRAELGDLPPLVANGRLTPNAGLDLRYGADPELALTATVNPDFGQVERDAAVLNLGWSETYYSERRPFFTADPSLFRTPLELFYSRRIGAPPPAPASSPGASLVSLEREARILAALRLSGEQGRATYGALSATVLPTSARERLADGSERELAASPWTHYGVGRLLVRLGSRSSLGAIATALTRDGPDAYAGGLDWDLRAASGWQTTGQLAAATAGRGSGYGLSVRAGQLGAPRWRAWVDAEAFSPGFEVNDLGYQWRNDMVRLRGFVQRRLPAPWRALREWTTTLYSQVGFNHERPSLVFERRLELQSSLQLTSRWDLGFGLGHRFAVLDDREARGGPAYPRPAESYGWLSVGTDSSRRLYASWYFDLSQESGGGGLWVSTSGALNLALLDRLTASLSASGRFTRAFPRWVTTQHEQARERYLFGDLDRDELELLLSAKLVLLRRLSLGLYGQLLHSAGSYRRFRELLPLADGGALLGPTPLVPDAAFARLWLNLGASLRWDLGDGTAAYLVYKLDGSNARDGDGARFDLGAGLRELRGGPLAQTLLVKVSYGWNL